LFNDRALTFNGLIAAEEGWDARVVKKQLTEPRLMWPESFEMQKDEGRRALVLL